MPVNNSSQFQADTEPYKGGKKMKKGRRMKTAKALQGPLKQTEGYTPRKAMPSKAKAAGGKRGIEKRLSGIRM